MAVRYRAGLPVGAAVSGPAQRPRPAAGTSSTVRHDRMRNDMSKTTFYDLLRELEKDGRVVENAEEKWMRQ